MELTLIIRLSIIVVICISTMIDYNSATCEHHAIDEHRAMRTDHVNSIASDSNALFVWDTQDSTSDAQDDDDNRNSLAEPTEVEETKQDEVKKMHHVSLLPPIKVKRLTGPLPDASPTLLNLDPEDYQLNRVSNVIDCAGKVLVNAGGHSMPVDDSKKMMQILQKTDACSKLPPKSKDQYVDPKIIEDANQNCVNACANLYNLGNGKCEDPRRSLKREGSFSQLKRVRSVISLNNLRSKTRPNSQHQGSILSIKSDSNTDGSDDDFGTEEDGAWSVVKRSPIQHQQTLGGYFI